METFSRDTLMVVPGAATLIAEVEKLMPVHVISTSYTPYVRAVADVLGVPAGRCHSTELSLDAWDLPPDEAVWLRDWAVRIGQQDLIELPDGAGGLADLSSGDQQTVRELDGFFWHELALQAPTAAAMVACGDAGRWPRQARGSAADRRRPRGRRGRHVRRRLHHRRAAPGRRARLGRPGA